MSFDKLSPDLEGGGGGATTVGIDLEEAYKEYRGFDDSVLDDLNYYQKSQLNDLRDFENRLRHLERDLAAHSLTARAIEIRFLLTDSGESVTAKVSTAEPIGRAKRRLARETGAPTRAQSVAQKWAFGG